MRNRIVHAPMSVCYADESGAATRAMVEHYGRRAQGGVGMVIIENVAIQTGGRQMPKQPMLQDRDALPGFRKLAEAITSHGALAVMQIVHSGRYAGPWEYYEQRRRLAPSAIPFPLPGKTVTPQEITLDEIDEVIDAFANTARLAMEAGFDGVEIHGAAGFLISQFLSPRMNVRTDEYGGSLDNRCRFGLRVADAVRHAVGPDALVGVQQFSDELHPEGTSVAEACYFAQQLEAHGCDFLVPVVGSFETLRFGEHVGINRRTAYQLQPAIAIKKAVNIPVFANGGLGDPATAEQVLRNGEADAIGLARPLFADPDWATKVQNGHADQIRVCKCEQSTCFRTQLSGGICESWPESYQQQGYLGFGPDQAHDRARA